MLFRLACLFLAVGLAGCSSLTVHTYVLMPARQEGMLHTKRIGVTRLAGDDDGRYTARLQSHLAGISVKGQPCFTLVQIDRDAILNELKASNSGQFDAKTAVKLGKLVAVDTIVSGAVTPPQHRVKHSRQERQKCVAGVYNKASKRYSKCTKYRTVRVKCSKHTSDFGLSLRATDVERGTISLVQDYRGASQDFTCEDRRTAKSAFELNEAAIGQVLEKIRQDVAPYMQSFAVSFLDHDSEGWLGFNQLNFGDHKEAQNLFEQGLENVENHNIHRACELFRQAVGLYDGSPALHHNIGVCLEIDGQLDQAISSYQTADRLSGGALEEVRVSLARAQANKASRSRAEQQLHGP